MPTLKCLGVRWLIGGDGNGNARIAVAYRKIGSDNVAAGARPVPRRDGGHPRAEPPAGRPDDVRRLDLRPGGGHRVRGQAVAERPRRRRRRADPADEDLGGAATFARRPHGGRLSRPTRRGAVAGPAGTSPAAARGRLSRNVSPAERRAGPADRHRGRRRRRGDPRRPGGQQRDQRPRPARRDLREPHRSRTPAGASPSTAGPISSSAAA